MNNVATAKLNINGWHTIAGLLERNGRNQSWLAEQLKMTPASITQIKTEKFRLSSSELAAICRVTHATRSEQKALYSEVINARFFDGKNKIDVVLK